MDFQLVLVCWWVAIGVVCRTGAVSAWVYVVPSTVSRSRVYFTHLVSCVGSPISGKLRHQILSHKKNFLYSWDPFSVTLYTVISTLKRVKCFIDGRMIDWISILIFMFGKSNHIKADILKFYIKKTRLNNVLTQIVNHWVCSHNFKCYNAYFMECPLI